MAAGRKCVARRAPFVSLGMSLLRWCGEARARTMIMQVTSRAGAIVLSLLGFSVYTVFLLFFPSSFLSQHISRIRINKSRFKICRSHYARKTQGVDGEEGFEKTTEQGADSAVSCCCCCCCCT
jgi:hypothetical protein